MIPQLSLLLLNNVSFARAAVRRWCCATEISSRLNYIGRIKSAEILLQYYGTRVHHLHDFDYYSVNHYSTSAGMLEARYAFVQRACLSRTAYLTENRKILELAIIAALSMETGKEQGPKLYTCHSY